MGKIKIKELQPPKAKKILINLKVTRDELVDIRRRARQYTGGNVSMWLRYAGTKLVPSAEDLGTCSK